jgi:hypothetical protein
VDEAQDLTPMQCRAVARRSAHGSLTVLGDMAQAPSPGAADGWPVLLSHLGKPDATMTVLDRRYRVPAQIIDYAARLLPTIAPGLGTPTSARQAPGALHVTQIALGDLADIVTATCRERLRERGSVRGHRDRPRQRRDLRTAHRGRSGRRAARRELRRDGHCPAGVPAGEPGQGPGV